VSAFGLEDSEARAVANRFGVAIEQVRHDHLISHILAALSASLCEQVIFFGSTALARIYLPTGRLSEDIDLIATGTRRETAAAIEQTLEGALRRSHGRISWAPGLTAVRDTDAVGACERRGRFVTSFEMPVDQGSEPDSNSDLEGVDPCRAAGRPFSINKRRRRRPDLGHLTFTARCDQITPRRSSRT
jgi:hypothetical protein